MKTTKYVVTAAAILSCGALLSGCGSANSADSDDGEVKTIEDGTLTVGLSPDFPPMEYLDGDKLVGSDVEMITAVAKKMDMKVKFEHQKFDQLINSVRTDRVDLVISGMGDSVERQKTLEFVDYYNSKGRFYTTPENEDEFTENTDVCGAPVAVSTKTDYYPDLQAYSKKVCEKAGLDPVKIVKADAGAAARLQLTQGRAKAAVQGAENLAYFEKEDPGKFKIVLDPVSEQPMAAGVKKGNMALAKEVKKAFQEMYDDGTSKEILEKHGLGEGLISPEINGVKE
jgi:polar amino acid transport system substrate-binding protein